MLFCEISWNILAEFGEITKKFQEMLVYEISRNILAKFREIIGMKFCEISRNFAK
jgi:hypothetical protein